MDDQIPSPKELSGDAEALDTPPIEYCVWQGDTFIPATPEKVERIRERVRTALWCLREWARLDHPGAIRGLRDRVHVLLTNLDRQPASYLHILCGGLAEVVSRPDEIPRGAGSRCNVSINHRSVRRERGNHRGGDSL